MQSIPPYVDNIPKSDKLRRLVWSVFTSILFRPFSLPIFNGWRLCLLRMFGAKIGNHSIVYSSAYIPSPWNLEMGDRSVLGPQVKLHLGKTIIGNKVTISQRAYLCSASHQINSINKPFYSGTILIKDFAWVAAESFIMVDVSIGIGAIVGARAAVFKNVDDWHVVGGNPAKFIKIRDVYDYENK